MKQSGMKIKSKSASAKIVSMTNLYSFSKYKDKRRDLVCLNVKSEFGNMSFLMGPLDAFLGSFGCPPPVIGLRC